MIRAATKEDNQIVCGLIRQLSPYSFSDEQFETSYDYNLETNYILVYEENEHICGCGVLSIHYPMQFSRKSAEIAALVVDENARNRGIGKELLLYLEKIAIENGCFRLEVATGKQRKEALRFYEREGFDSTHYKLAKRFSTSKGKEIKNLVT